MASSDLERFRLKVREYRLLVNRNQSDLAAYLNLDYNELSSRLNANKKVRLSHDNVRAIVRALAEWGAINTRAQAEELLEVMLCPLFDSVDWQARPLSKLTASPIHNPISQTPTPIGSSIFSLQKRVDTSFIPPTHPGQNNLEVEVNHNLPHKLSSFIGRQNETASLTKLLVEDRTRLVTLVGVGGTGKTRLAIHLGVQLLQHFAEGVWLVELAPLNNPAQISQAIVETLGVTEQPGRGILDTLVQYLGKRQVLLILDNCEHLVEECSQVVERLLEHSTQLQILTTSREGLGIGGEEIFQVPSLSLPLPDQPVTLENIADYEASQLFVERAMTTNPDFKLEQCDVPTLIQICQRLDGIPLALELAAVRTRVLSLRQIQTRLNDRFQLLTSGSRTTLPRQQTLRAMVEWSYNLLSEPEKRLLARSSVFVGSWDLVAGEYVCSGPELEEYKVLDELSSLVNKSLLSVNKQGEDLYYHQLETIRQYGLEKLRETGEEEEIRVRHLTYYARLSEELGTKLKDQGQATSLKRIDRELDNLRAAIEYGLKVEQAEKLLQLTSGLGFYWDTRGYYTEGRQILEKALALPGASGISRGRALTWIGFFAYKQGDVEAINPYYTEALALSKEYDDKELLLYTLVGQTIIYLGLGEYAKARVYCEEFLRLTEDMDPFAKAAAMTNLGEVILEQGEYEEACRLFEESVIIARELGNPWTLEQGLLNLGALALLLTDYPAAYRYLEEALATSEEIGYRKGKITSLALLGLALVEEDRLEEARRSLEESLVLIIKGGDRIASWPGLVGLVRLLSKAWLKRRQEAILLEQVICLGGAILALVDSKELVLGQLNQCYYEQAMSEARAGFSKTTFEVVFARGQKLCQEEIIVYAKHALAEI